VRKRGVALLCLGIAACTSPSSTSTRSSYQRWLEGGHRAQAEAYDSYLHAQGIGGVIPLHELLRSGRRWSWCGVDEFALPPREDWASIKPTLRLVADLQDAGVFTDLVVASAWRSPSFNRCEGGSSASRHLTNNALDFDIRGTLDVVGLCAYWRNHGAARKFGLGFYSATEIHVDTSGFRTWGYDYHRATSLCAQSPRAFRQLEKSVDQRLGR